MVTKTEPCVFSEYRIYPGKGKKFVAKDGKIYYFISAKTASLFHQKKKAVKLTWSQAWRRFNKKIKADEIIKRRTKKTTRVQKAIVGISLDEIKRRRAEKPEERDKKIDQQKKARLGMPAIIMVQILCQHARQQCRPSGIHR